MSFIKAVLFDMDGVLVDARDWHYKALNDALRNFGVEINEYDHEEVFDGLPTKAKLRMLTKQGKLPVGLHEIIGKLKQKRTRTLIEINCKPIYEIELIFQKLKAGGYKIGLCSNSIKDTIIRMMELSNLLDYFDIILSNEDVKNSKPDPEIYLKAMSSLNVSPNQTLIVEDNENGIKAAKASGGNLLKVKNPYEMNWQIFEKRLDNFTC
tara:strand:+ start:1841 stop:2467 length:627 start_codon:yes stop_codon:yes gene_type:complete